MDWLRLACLALALAFPNICLAKESITIYLKTGTLKLDEPTRSATNIRGLLDSTSASPPGSSGSDPSLAQAFFVSYAVGAQRGALYKHLRRNRGIVHGFIPENTWLVSSTPAVLSEALSRGLAISILPCLPEHKVAPEWSYVVPGGALFTARGDSSSQTAESTSAGTAEALGMDGARDSDGGANFDSVQEAPSSSPARQYIHRPRISAQPRGRRLIAAICAADLPAALAWLSSQREVHWLEPTPRLARRDLAGDLVVQLGGRDMAAVAAAAAAAVQPAGAAALPYWSRGLDGSSQLLGISDSGVDMDSCYFFDPSMPNVAGMLVQDPTRRGARVFRSDAHRKVASYYCYSDFGDADGHGTHVSGIAVGACYGSIQGRNVSGGGGGGEGVVAAAPPSPLPLPRTSPGPPATAALMKTYKLPSYEEILQYQLDVGVFVQSDSWGSKQAFWYNSLCEQLDDVTWRNPQLLVLTAAGNDGNLQPRPANGTVSAPANAKNTLSVGSTLSWEPATDPASGTLRLRIWTGTADPPDTKPIVVVATAALDTVPSNTTGRGVAAEAEAEALGLPSGPPSPPPRRRKLPAASPAPPASAAALPSAFSFDLLVDLPHQTSGGGGGGDFRTLKDLEGMVMEVIAATPSAACRKLANAAQAQAIYGSGMPKMILALRGGCMVYVKAMAAAAAGAAAVAIINDTPGAVQSLLQVNPTNTTLPTAPLSQTVGLRVLMALGAGARVFARAEWHPDQPYSQVPSFSAYGPTVDGRIKPDLVAPGVAVLSAWTDGMSRGASDNCTTRRVMSGTSMSAPLVAGAAVLARQYFTTGFYPFGRNDTPGAAPFIPSGMLLKAVLIGGAYDMQQGMSLSTLTQLEPAPSGYQGFGRADLSSSLPLGPQAAAASASASASASSSSSSSKGNSKGGSGASSTSSCANPSLQLIDYVPIQEGDVHAYYIIATGSGTVVVTLAWPDPPAESLALYALVNNLDLEVVLSTTSSTGRATDAAADGDAVMVFYGNSGWSAGGANGSRTDRRNTVERVTVPAGRPGTLQIRVVGAEINSRYITRFATDDQRYALAVHGCFTGLLLSEHNPDRRAWRRFMEPGLEPPSPLLVAPTESVDAQVR
ncbi:hypothetical protein VOLCADRAFT_96935 [Volvox carteri f. nagariensis]|uniref:Peptidase S8/S53 domain-containing protein n=1 Tax=Volvox carteri f. nagariensis TaxID=3068 RepID=D8UBD4_VOLCA|nr:uncharacterized protein VOLCADRAFT_96935 [Volvox carteri f. nagariensis]EFJ42929.1 hypothetical protein VOLCADRAFT_96935 [Volvox carteri f. nagariensis]|eukprot:XP_002955969.1 hypothetical protein VOLCADRAFT_96935 [Volvox carteri f. nagariensis]